MNIPPIVADILRGSAPTLLTALALPVPFNFMAAAAVTAVLRRYLPEGEAPAAVTPQGEPALAPEQVVRIVQEEAPLGTNNLKDDLRLAELRVKEVEATLPLKFEEIAARDRQSARETSVSSGLAPVIFEVAKTTLKNDRIMAWTTLAGGLGLLVVTGFFSFPLDPIVSNAIFTLIGVVLGRQAARADQVAAFLFGSTNSSRAKDETLAQAVRDAGVAATLPRSPVPLVVPAPLPVPVAPPASPEAPRPALEAVAPVVPPRPPAPPQQGVASLSAAQLAALMRPHARFPGSVQWALVPDGISVQWDRSPAMRTVGEPETVRRIWRDYGPLIIKEAKFWNVPIELIVATIATESGGNPNAYRQEPDKRESSGLMQTLLGTAGEVLGRSVSVQDLRDPTTSLNAGTGYISKQSRKTGLDPILVAAAYNAGSIRPADFPGNPWKLYCYPPETGKHCTEFARWFGDAMRESRMGAWGEDEPTHSFASALNLSS